MRGLAAMSAPKMYRAGNVPRSLVANARLARTECRLLRTVLRESWEESLKGPLPNLIVDFSSSSLLRDRVAVHPKNVVDTADAKTFTKESKFCLWVLAQLNTLMHSSSDVCFGQELVRDELTGPTATLSVWLPAATVETEASKRTSSIYHSGRAASRSATW